LDGNTSLPPFEPPLILGMETISQKLKVTSRADVVRTGVGSAVACALGADILLVITVTVPVTAEAWMILVASLVSLTVTSIVGARSGRMNQLGKASFCS
jgi:hypothetical protein